MPRKQTQREKIEQWIARKKNEDVFLTREFKGKRLSDRTALTR